MTKVELLSQLKLFTEDAIRELLLPVRMQKDDAEQPAPRPATVYLMRLPDSTAAAKKAPYIIHQAITGSDSQAEGQHIQCITAVRSIFCVYSDDEQAGGMLLLDLMERVRIALLRQVVIGRQFELDLQNNFEQLIYPDDTAPYYAGEMMSNWKMPAVEREVAKWLR